MLGDDSRKLLKEKLLTLEKELIEAISNAKESSKPVTLDQQATGRVSRIDAIQQQQMSLAALKRQEQQLALVRQALSKVDTESFGLCIKCEEPISEERLIARPESPICKACIR